VLAGSDGERHAVQDLRAGPAEGHVLQLEHGLCHARLLRTPSGCVRLAAAATQRGDRLDEIGTCLVVGFL
jgi:hypothetical protein